MPVGDAEQIVRNQPMVPFRKAEPPLFPAVFKDKSGGLHSFSSAAGSQRAPPNTFQS